MEKQIKQKAGDDENFQTSSRNQVRPVELIKHGDKEDETQQPSSSKTNLKPPLPPAITDENDGIKPKSATVLINPIKPSNVQKPPLSNSKRPVIWDCGSTLYDSFELNSFKRQLDLALTTANHKAATNNHLMLSSSSSELGAKPTRTHSMPHLSHGRRLSKESLSFDLPLGQTPNHHTKTKHSKLSKSFNKLIRSLIPKSSSSSSKPPPIPTKPLLNNQLNYDDQDEKRSTTSRPCGAAKWILVYEDDIIYDEDIGVVMTAHPLSTIPEVPEVAIPSPVVVNNRVVVEEEEDEDTPRLRRRLSSSSFIGRRTMSDRFVNSTHATTAAGAAAATCRSVSDGPFRFVCGYRQKQQQHRDDLYV